MITKRAPRVDWDPPCDDRACSLAVELDALRKVAEAAQAYRTAHRTDLFVLGVAEQALDEALDAWRKLRLT